MQRRRRTALSGMVLAAVLATSGALGPAEAVAGRPTVLSDGVVERIAGTDRVQTAVAVAMSEWSSSREVVLASAATFADALAAVPLAARLDAPLLLTDPTHVSEQVLDEVRRLGASRVTVVGGTAAVGLSVETALASVATVRRLAGSDRYATAAAVARTAGPGANGDVVLVSGSDRAWPDALSAGALVAAPGSPPVVLTAPDALETVSRDAVLELLGADGRVRIVGGLSAVSAAVEAQFEATSTQVERLSGPDRYLTSLEVAGAALREQDVTPRPLVAATGAGFADGLSAGALAAHLGGIVVLLPPVPLPSRPEVDAWLGIRGARFDRTILVGGTAALPETTAATLGATLTAAPLVLPPPAPPPAPGDSRGIAEDFVHRLRVGDVSERRAVLLSAVSWIGFAVTNGDGSLAIAADPVADQGVVLPAWQALAVAENPDAHSDVPFSTMVEEAASGVPGLASDELVQALLTDVASVSAADDAGLDRWSKLVVAAGAEGSSIYDAGQRLTALQTTLVFTRLAAESAVRNRAGDVAVRTLAEPVGNPCTPTGADATVLDWAGVGASTAFGLYWEYVGRVIPSATRFAQVLPFASTSLAAVQALLALSQLELGTELTPAAPVSRTFERSRDTTPGEVGTVRMSVRLGSTDLEVFNCGRIVLNSLGIDFSVGAGGPVPAARVTATDLAPALVEYPISGQHLVDRRTDAAGVVSATVRGKAQPYDLGDAPIALDTRQTWRVAVNASPNDLLKDVRDVAAGEVGGGVQGGVTPLIVRTITAASLFSTFTAWAPVRDWSDGRVIEISARLRTDTVTDYQNGVTKSEWRSDYTLAGRVALDEGASEPLRVVAASGEGGWTRADAENACNRRDPDSPRLCDTRTTVTGSQDGVVTVTGVTVDEFGVPTAVAFSLDPVPVAFTSSTCEGGCGPGSQGPGRTWEIESNWQEALDQFGDDEYEVVGFAPVGEGRGAGGTSSTSYTSTDDDRDLLVTFTVRPGRG